MYIKYFIINLFSVDKPYHTDIPIKYISNIWSYSGVHCFLKVTLWNTVMNQNQSPVHLICKNLCLEILPGCRNETIIASFQ